MNAPASPFDLGRVAALGERSGSPVDLRFQPKDRLWILDVGARTFQGYDLDEVLRRASNEVRP